MPAVSAVIKADTGRAECLDDVLMFVRGGHGTVTTQRAGSMAQEYPLVHLAEILGQDATPPRLQEQVLPALAGGAIAAAVAKVPDAFLAGDARFASPAEARAAYRGHLERRLEAAHLFVEETVHARA